MPSYFLSNGMLGSVNVPFFTIEDDDAAPVRIEDVVQIRNAERLTTARALNYPVSRIVYHRIFYVDVRMRHPAARTVCNMFAMLRSKRILKIVHAVT
jgi:hypothetical protein